MLNLYLFSNCIYADVVDSLYMSLKTRSQVQEKIYLQLDNTCYFKGDTIWYKAYTLRADNLKPTDMSRILYVELLTPDGYLVERQQLVIDYDGAYFTVSAALACVAFFLVILAENSRLPVDNPDTHLELTMIHEGMTLEYSGPLLTLIHLGSMLKIMVFLTLFGALYLPLAVPLAVKILFGAVLIGVVEILNNKMRLFKMRVYLGAAIVLLLLAIIAE